MSFIFKTIINVATDPIEPVDLIKHRPIQRTEFRPISISNS